jgi:2-octaprenyl-6-methoxyphenol hydroxylase
MKDSVVGKANFDVAVVGGGLVGQAAAIIAAGAGRSVIHIAPEGPPDRRTSALMEPSVAFLARAGLVSDPGAIGVPLSEIRIIDATDRLLRAPETLFRSSEAGLAAFGWNFANVRLAQAFAEVAERRKNLTRCPAKLVGAERRDGLWHLQVEDGQVLEVRLLVGADGKSSPVRGFAGIGAHVHSFAQAALVCDLTLARPIGGCSIEFHYPDGPFTLVPAGEDKANLVWIDREPVLRAAANSEATLAEALAQKSMRLFGALKPITSAHVFPLSTLGVDVAGRDGVVLVGEAAHAFPPIGAQGLNLGLRDVEDLANALGKAQGADWADTVSADYAKRRSGDLARTGAFVDTLFRSLLSDMLPAQALRSAGLWTLKSLPGLRRRAFSLGMGR